MSCAARGGLVAIVDDDAAVGDSLAFLLRVAGYRAVAYRSAIAFLDDCETPPACLIVDHDMPGMTGLQLAEKLHREGANVPCLIITGLPTAALSLSAAQCGVYAVLAKPFEPDYVVAFVAAHLQATDC